MKDLFPTSVLGIAAILMMGVLGAFVGKSCQEASRSRYVIEEIDGHRFIVEPHNRHRVPPVHSPECPCHKR